MTKNKELKVLFIGDIIAEIGRNAVKKILPSLKKKYAVDLVIANGEHLSDRVGIDIEAVHEMKGEGIDLFTTGNHVWKKKDFENHIGRSDVPVIRPANFKDDLPGKGWQKIPTKIGEILIVNLLGSEGIDVRVENPFLAVDEIISGLKSPKPKAIIVDFHAEMSSEKVAMSHFLDGKVTAVLGTHTHVPTADGRVLPGGTAAISDVGMVGPRDSVLGVKSEIIIERFKTNLPQRFEIAEGPCIFNAVLVTIDCLGKATKIKRIDRVVK